jgi:hypothetical protein
MKNVYLVCAITFAFVSCNCQKKALDQSPSAATVSAVNQQNMRFLRKDNHREQQRDRFSRSKWSG